MKKVVEQRCHRLILKSLGLPINKRVPHASPRRTCTIAAVFRLIKFLLSPPVLMHCGLLGSPSVHPFVHLSVCPSVTNARKKSQEPFDIGSANLVW